MMKILTEDVQILKSIEAQNSLDLTQQFWQALLLVLNKALKLKWVQNFCQIFGKKVIMKINEAYLFT